MRTFRCTLCGLCCRASPISILPHEDYILKALAQRLGVKYRSRPGYRVYDKRTGRDIALSYVMELVKGKCPFLREDNLCMIQNIYKPLICRSFPYVPKQVKYIISNELKFVYAKVEYGVSGACPVIKEDKEVIMKLMSITPYWHRMYFPQEYIAAMEMEEKRSLLLRLLSKLWASGIVDIDSSHGGIHNTINLYELLRTYFPNLPYIMGLGETINRIRTR